MVNFGELHQNSDPISAHFRVHFGIKNGSLRGPVSSETQGNTMVLVLLGGPKWIHSWVVLGVISGSILYPLMGYGMISSFDGLARAGCSEENDPVFSFFN